MKSFGLNLGRRRFLMAAGMASTSALAYKGLAKVIDPVFHTNVATAAEKSGAADLMGTNKRYGHLLSPLKIGNKVLKNRMFLTYGSPPHMIQGSEIFPSDQVRSFYANAARGAAVVFCPTRVPSGSAGAPHVGGGGATLMTVPKPTEVDMDNDSFHMTMYDSSVPRTINYVDQVIESIRSMGSLVCGDGFASDMDIIDQAKMVEDEGVDLMRITPSDYRDKNAIRSAIKQIEAIKKATNLLIWSRFHVYHPLLPREQEENARYLTLDESIEFVKTFEGYIDIMKFRLAGMMHSHPDGYCQEEGKPDILYCSQAIKETGVKMILAPNGGFQNLDESEEAVASGKCDMIVMSRPWHADYEYGQKAYEGRGEDVVPCVMCNRCHGIGGGPWYARCTVNPALGLESAVKIFPVPVVSKRVAVIGGGPAGMKAAITAAERGHKVTLYEKNAALGGLLLNTDFDSYRWPYKRFKNYLVRQVKKSGVEVFLRTQATPEMIKERGYDAVVVAAGAEPNIPKIPGAEGKNVWNVVNVYGREKELGKNVVVVGGEKYGTQTATYLAKAGHNVTVLASSAYSSYGGEKVLFQSGGPHQDSSIEFAYKNLKNFTAVTEVTTTRISDDKVTYKDASGGEKSIPADSVVIYAGLRPLQEEALKFYDSARNGFYIAGDCTGRCGDVQKSIRSGFLIGSQV